MPPPSESQAYTDALAAKTAIKDAANQKFIDEATIVINEAIAQGKFQIYISSVKDMSLKDIFDYFTGLGYQIGFIGPCNQYNPGFPWCYPWNPWHNWYCQYKICCCPTPCRVFILWPNP